MRAISSTVVGEPADRAQAVAGHRPAGQRAAPITPARPKSSITAPSRSRACSWGASDWASTRAPVRRWPGHGDDPVVGRRPCGPMRAHARTAVPAATAISGCAERHAGQLGRSTVHLSPSARTKSIRTSAAPSDPGRDRRAVVSSDSAGALAGAGAPGRAATRRACAAAASARSRRRPGPRAPPRGRRPSWSAGSPGWPATGGSATGAGPQIGDQPGAGGRRGSSAVSSFRT